LPEWQKPGIIKETPMPNIRKSEKRSEYVSRAVPILMKEGLSQKAAVGKAEGMYSSHKVSKKKTKRHK